jgi:hypothetical protein
MNLPLAFALLLASTAPSTAADATLTRQRGAPALAVDGVVVPVGRPVRVKAGPHRVRVGSGEQALEGAVLLLDHAYVFRENLCSGFELIDEVVAPLANKGVTLQAQRPTQASVNVNERMVAGSAFVEVAVSAMCPAAPIWIKAGETTRVAFLAAGQHAVVVVDAPGGPNIEIVQAPAELLAACNAETRIAVVENPPADPAAAATPGSKWVALLRAAGCTVVRGPERARQVRSQNALFARVPAPTLAAALQASEGPLNWPSDVDVVLAVATAPPR